MSDQKKEEESQKHAFPPGERYVHRRHSSSVHSEKSKERRGSRRISLTQGLKDGGRKVVTVVESLFKDSRGEKLDLEDDPEYVKGRPTWEEDLKKYLPEDPSHSQLWNMDVSPPMSTSMAQSHQSPAENISPSPENVASSSSVAPMTPINTVLNLMAGIRQPPKSLAAYRWHKAYEHVKRQNALKKKALSTPIGTGAKLHGHALGIIPIDDVTRRAVFDFLYNSSTEYLLLCLISGHIIVLILKAESKFVTSFKPSKSGLNAADIVLTTFYTVEMLSRIFCLGLCQGPHSYWRKSFNKLDLVIVVDSWVHIARTVILKNDAFLRIAILRIFRILLSLRHLNFIGNVLAIMDAIAKSMYSLRTVFVFTIMFLSFYSMVGVLFFGGMMQRRCVRETDNQVSYPMVSCILDPAIPYGYLCPDTLDQYCVVNYGNPNFGVSSWDNYASGMLILFQMLTFEGWSLQMYTVNEANGYSNVFFCIFVVLGGYFIVNIYVAAISSVFLRVRQEHQILLKKHRRDKALSFANAIHMANLLKDVILQDDDDARLTWTERIRRRTSRKVQKLRASMSRQGTRLKRSFSKAVDWNDPNSYLKRISSFGLASMDEPLAMQEAGQSIEPARFGRSFSRNISIGSQKATQLGRSFSRSISMTTFVAAQTVSQKAAVIVNSKIFLYAVLTIISLNMAGLCTLRAKMSATHQKRLEIMEIGVLIIFTIEMILRFLAAGFQGFVDERMNVVDVCIIIISFCVVGFGPDKKFPNLTPIRMLRWFYQKNSHKTTLRDQENTSIVVAIIRSFGALSSVFFFLTLVILIFSIMAMELWGGQYYNFVEGYPRANFDTIFQAMLTWFSVTTAESWPDNMWNTMRPGVPYRWMGPILFVVYYVVSAIVILNLIMAVILEQTELTDNQKKYIQKRDHIKWLQTKHAHHVSHTRSSEWLVGAVQGAHKGYKGMKRRMTSMQVSHVSRMSLFPVFQPETGFVRMVAPPQTGPPQDKDILPRTISGPLLQIPDAKAPVRRHSYTTVNIPGTISDLRGEDKTKARIFRRSSLGALSSAGLMPQTVSGTHMRRRPSHDADKVLLRSGFGSMTTSVESGDHRTALQTALLNVVHEQKEVADMVMEDKKQAVSLAAVPVPDKATDPRIVQPTFGKMPSRKDKAPRVSFAMSDYEGFQSAGEKKIPWWLSDPSLFLFSSDNKFRIFCNKIVENKWYLYWQYAFIIISCFVVIQTKQLGGFNFLPSKPLFVRSLDYMVLIVFALDFLMKIVAYGFLFAPEAYLGDPFNFIDLFSLIVHILKLKTRKAGYWFNTFLLLSCTRPARFLVRAHGLRKLSISLFRTLPAIGQVFTFTVVVYAIYAVIGMQLYANRFRSCTDPYVEGHADCVGYHMSPVGIMAPRIWINPPFHFDAFGEAMLALFVASTFDNWLNYFAYTSMDLAHHQELQPQRNISPSHAIFFVSFGCIGGFFILRMFVGVFIDQFGIISGTKLLTERQKLWRDTNRIIQSLKPTRLQKHTQGLIRGTCYKVVNSRKFELFIILVITINYAYIAAQHYGQAAPVDIFDRVEIMFVCLYLLEALMKLLGTQFEDWWHHKWNLVELVLILVSTFCLWPQRQTKIDQQRRLVGGFIYMLRIFRVIRYIPQLSNMASTVWISFPGMVDIVGLMGIVLFFFAGVGTNLFTNLKMGSCYNGFNMSFFSFTQAFVMLFQVTTLDNWSCLLPDITVSPPSCTVGSGLYNSDCGLPVAGIVYMVILVCVTSHIFANLFVAQIIDTITFGLLDENAMLTPSHLFDYQKLWAQKEFDYHCTGYIGHHKLREFVNRLGPPLGRRLTFRDKWITRIEYEAFHFRSPKGIPFKSLLETLVLYKIGPRGLELPVRIERERQIQGVYRKGAAIKIQALVRGYLQRKGWSHHSAKESSREGETQIVDRNVARGQPSSE